MFEESDDPSRKWRIIGTSHDTAKTQQICLRINAFEIAAAEENYISQVVEAVEWETIASLESLM